MKNYDFRQLQYGTWAVNTVEKITENTRFAKNYTLALLIYVFK